MASLNGTGWTVMRKNKKFDDARVRAILDQFNLHHRRGTLFLSKDNSATLALCKEGVFIFAVDFHSACLVSDNLLEALDYIRSVSGKLPAGPVKEPGAPYFEENEKKGRIDL